MSGKQYKLLVIDIDGTLINKEGAVSDKDIQALKRVTGAGIIVAISTGRVVQASKPILDKLPLNGYHIFSDGALVLNPQTGDELYVDPVKKEMVERLVHYAHNSHLHFDFYSSRQYFIEEDDWTTDIRRRFFLLEPTYVDFNSIWQTERIIKGTLIVRTEEGRATARELQAQFDGGLAFSWTKTPRYPDIDFINILSSTVSKGKALGKLCAFLGIPLNQVMAIGDGSNDISLLSGAGLAVAMGNGTPALKKVAHHVTLDVEQSGVAAAIDRFLL
jgi:Cof subfamily protein (haloacid dehalogenase superfamily)